MVLPVLLLVFPFPPNGFLGEHRSNYLGWIAEMVGLTGLLRYGFHALMVDM